VAATLPVQSGVEGLREHTVSRVAEQPRPTPEGVHEEIEIPVAIDIDEDGAGRGLSGAPDPGSGGDVLETPVAEVPVEAIVPAQAAEIGIAATIAIDITEGESGTVLQQPVCGDLGRGQSVDETETRRLGRDDGKACGPSYGSDWTTEHRLIREGEGGEPCGHDPWSPRRGPTLALG
jgi:hypothetical protein